MTVVKVLEPTLSHPTGLWHEEGELTVPFDVDCNIGHALTIELGAGLGLCGRLE